MTSGSLLSGMTQMGKMMYHRCQEQDAGDADIQSRWVIFHTVLLQKLLYKFQRFIFGRLSLLGPVRLLCPGICIPPFINYLHYLATDSTLMAVVPFQLPVPQSGTLFQISSRIQPSVQTVSDVCLKHVRSLDTIAFSMLEVLDNNGMPGSLHCHISACLVSTLTQALSLTLVILTVTHQIRLHLGPVAPISVNFNHQLAYFADHSDTTHVRHQPTAVA